MESKDTIKCYKRLVIHRENERDRYELLSVTQCYKLEQCINLLSTLRKKSSSLVEFHISRIVGVIF